MNVFNKFIKKLKSFPLMESIQNSGLPYNLRKSALERTLRNFWSTTRLRPIGRGYPVLAKGASPPWQEGEWVSRERRGGVL
jgi:hypothetical protein